MGKLRGPRNPPASPRVALLHCVHVGLSKTHCAACARDLTLPLETLRTGTTSAARGTVGSTRRPIAAELSAARHVDLTPMTATAAVGPAEFGGELVRLGRSLAAAARERAAERAGIAL